MSGRNGNFFAQPIPNHAAGYTTIMNHIDAIMTVYQVQVKTRDDRIKDLEAELEEIKETTRQLESENRALTDDKHASEKRNKELIDDKHALEKRNKKVSGVATEFWVNVCKGWKRLVGGALGN